MAKKPQRDDEAETNGAVAVAKTEEPAPKLALAEIATALRVPEQTVIQAVEDYYEQDFLAADDKTISPNEAARLTGFSRHSIMDMIRKGWLIAYRAPGTVIHKIRVSHLSRIMKASCLGKGIES